MASLTQQRRAWLLRFTFRGKLQHIRLRGRLSEDQVERLKRDVDELLAEHPTGATLSSETRRWLERVPHRVRARLRARLTECGVIRETRLAEFLDRAIDSKAVQESTRAQLARVARDVKQYFGAQRALESITAGHAAEFRAWLSQERPRLGKHAQQSAGLGANTVRRTCGRAKQLFAHAVRLRLIEENPFGGMKNLTVGESKRIHFITRETASLVLAACPDVEWKLIFALCRFGGCRCPSEVLALRWSHVHWKHSTITVPSPKTAHLEGRESRTLPIFPELRHYLRAAQLQAPRDAEFVVGRYRGGKANLRTQLERIIRKAGLEPWPRPFQNLRSTRETELADEYPMHVVCGWLGNTPKVAQRHYLQVTAEHLAKAVGRDGDEEAANGAAIKRRKTGASQGVSSAVADPPCSPMQATSSVNTTQGYPARVRTTAQLSGKSRFSAALRKKGEKPVQPGAPIASLAARLAAVEGQLDPTARKLVETILEAQEARLPDGLNIEVGAVQ